MSYLKNIDSIELIMLCGQGSTGKSTYIKKYYPNSYCIGIDKIVGEGKYKYPEHFNIYIKDIQKALDLNKAQIVLDFSHDTIESRAEVLNRLKLNKKINFIAIGLHPDLDFIYTNMEKRQQRKLTNYEKNRIKECYEHFDFPSKEEFIKYNFNSIKIYNLQNY